MTEISSENSGGPDDEMFDGDHNPDVVDDGDNNNNNTSNKKRKKYHRHTAEQIREMEAYVTFFSFLLLLLIFQP